MSLERGKKLVAVVFPESGVTIWAKRIGPQWIRDGGSYLVDRGHNAGIVLKSVSGRSLPAGGWELKE
ncbi:MAG: hypothetical protein ABH867_02635 [Patescibacteria group bacterium]